MKKSLFIIATLILSLYLAGCTRNNVATRNQTVTEPRKVNYQAPRNGGPAITGVDMSNTGLNRNLNQTTPPTQNQKSRMRVADEAASRVADLPEVDTANIIVTNRNAYVAAKLSSLSRNERTSTIENKISQKVRSVDKDIDNVYVSTNPDFYDRMNTFAGDIRNGKPVSGFFNQFTETVRRIFPDAR